MAIVGSHTSSSRGSHQAVFDLSPADQVGGKAIHPDSTWLSTAGKHLLEIRVQSVWTNTFTFFGGFKLLIFGGVKFHTRFVCSFLGKIIPVLGRWAPLRPFILILCNVRIDQHPGILVSLTFRVNLGSCFLTWLSDCVHRKLKQLDIHPVLIAGLTSKYPQGK